MLKEFHKFIIKKCFVKSDMTKVEQIFDHPVKD